MFYYLNTKMFINIFVAKKVLQQTKHVLIVESGAQKLAVESNIPILSSEKLKVTSDSQTSLHEEEDNGNKKKMEKNEISQKHQFILIMISIHKSKRSHETKTDETIWRCVYRDAWTKNTRMKFWKWNSNRTNI